jgi:hypothetical protein
VSVLGPCAQYGPFRPQIPIGVPLWLAVILKKQGKCIVIPPRWLNVTKLHSLIELERGDDVFQVHFVCLFVVVAPSSSTMLRHSRFVYLYHRPYPFTT